jgi:hypothetical protein
MLPGGRRWRLRHILREICRSHHAHRVGSQTQNDKIRTQMHYARQGIVTEEMHYVAQRERIAARSWCARRWRAAG